MDEYQRYVFDTQGSVVLPEVLKQKPGADGFLVP